MKIFLHSDQGTFNNPVDRRIFEILNPKQIKIGYIPSSTDKERKHYESRKEWYMKYGVKNFLYFDLDEEYDETQLEKLSKCELIHLSGGDTFNFLKNIKRRDFKEFLVEYLDNGGVIVGVSAGSYVMTPTIILTTLYKDEFPKMDYTGMNLVNFEFLPHYQTKGEYLDMFLEYSKNNDDRNIYLCCDDNGIYVENGEIQILGEVKSIRNGEVIS